MRKAIPTNVRDRIRVRTAREGKISDFLSWAMRHKSPRWIFRGQSRSWPLIPAIGRSDRYRPELELQLLQEFKRAALPHIDRASLISYWDWLSVAQHHGLPTRLLDWTTNPLVAAYFAAQPSGRLKRDGIITAVETHSVPFYYPGDEKEEDPFSITEAGFLYPSALATRIISQRGLFSVHPDPTRAWKPGGRVSNFEIPTDMKNYFVEALFGMGIDAQFLMGDLDGISRSLGWRYDNGISFE